MALTPKRAAFVAEYLKDLNATQAAVRAGYSAKTADVQGPRLLGNAGVKAAIDEALAARAKRVGLEADDVLAGVVRVTEKAEEVADLAVALRGFELQGKHLGLWKDRVVVEGKLTLEQLVEASLKPPGSHR